jgi:hypothetical protein
MNTRNALSALINVCLKTLRCLWALPLTVWGLPWCFSPHAAVLNTPYGWVLTCHSPLVRLLLQHHPLGAMSAVAVGNCVLAVNQAALDEHWLHELEHVRQAQLWGCLFPLAYCACSIWAWLNKGSVYQDNYFERQANQVAAASRSDGVRA